MRQRAPKGGALLRTDVPVIEPSEDDTITDDVEYETPVFDVDDDWYTGKPFEPYPDQAPTAAQLQQIMHGLTEVIRAERDRLAQIGKMFARVSTNLSGSVQFRRYEITDTMGEVQIVWEKPFRGDIVITNLASVGSIWISDEPGLRPASSNVAEIPAGASRTIRTREELFAITNSVTSVAFDIQEEFDS